MKTGKAAEMTKTAGTTGMTRIAIEIMIAELTEETPKEDLYPATDSAQHVGHLKGAAGGTADPDPGQKTGPDPKIEPGQKTGPGPKIEPGLLRGPGQKIERQPKTGQRTRILLSPKTRERARILQRRGQEANRPVVVAAVAAAAVVRAAAATVYLKIEQSRVQLKSGNPRSQWRLRLKRQQSSSELHIFACHLTSQQGQHQEHIGGVVSMITRLADPTRRLSCFKKGKAGVWVPS